MAIETVPLLREDSILCWDIESTFKTPSASATWQSLGRVEEWEDLGPTVNVFREAIAGSGREAATIGADGFNYGPVTIGPFQIVDPRFLGFAWGQEEAAPSALGGGFYRHTAIPTKRGRHPSLSLQMADYKAGTKIDGSTFLGVVMPRISIRGEEVGEDGAGGRIMAAPTFVAHDEDVTVAGKAVTLPTSQPYTKMHAGIQFYNADTDWRIHSWEFGLDSNSKSNYYHNSAYNGKPTETPPEGVLYDVRFDIIADGHANLVTGSLLRDLVRNRTKGNAQIKYTRTANQDEWALNLTDIQLASAKKVRRSGKIHYDVVGHCRASTFEWVDANSTRYFPA